LNRLTLSLSYEASGVFDPPEVEEAFNSRLSSASKDMDSDESTAKYAEMSGDRMGRVGFEDERVRLFYRVPDLKAAIALHIADLAIGMDVRTCEECGKSFIVTDRRMKYCSTRCQERAKKRRQRANK
jgi:hypothetical protein